MKAEDKWLLLAGAGKVLIAFSVACVKSIFGLANITISVSSDE
jgi:hypothetical protein